MAWSVLLCAFVSPLVCRKQRKSICFGLSGISYHAFPQEKARTQQWIAKIRRYPDYDFVINNSTKACSELFTADDYSGNDPEASRCVLKKTAVPSLFPWNSYKVFQRTMYNSDKATALLGTCIS